MVQFGANSLATLEFALKWRNNNDLHEERFLARRVNTWRDIFPPGLTDALRDGAEGDSVTLDYDAGQIIPDHDPRKILTLPTASFAVPRVGGRAIPVAVGRHYPQGALQGLPHIYPQNAVPFRLTAMDDRQIEADCNHPLAGRPLSLTATIQHLEEKKSDTGGQLSHWVEEMCNYGPGMQAPLSGGALTPSDGAFFSRLDNSRDAAFYSGARIISHVDSQASRNLSSVYGRFVRPGMKILDLMSSIDSHLPAELDAEVVGLGMNDEEMAANGFLNQRVVHDLNVDASLPESVSKHGPFDVVLCSLSVEYLTRPVEVLRSVADVLAPGGVLLLGLSDRWFPAKAISGWMDLHPFERPGLVLGWARKAGITGKGGSLSIRNDWRPQDDRHFLETRDVSDPVYIVWAHKE